MNTIIKHLPILPILLIINCIVLAQADKNTVAFHVKQKHVEQKHIALKRLFDKSNYISFGYECGYKYKEIIIDTSGVAYFRWGNSNNPSSVSFTSDTTLIKTIKDIITPGFFDEIKTCDQVNYSGCTYFTLIVKGGVTNQTALVGITEKGKYNCGTDVRLKKMIELLDLVNKKYGYAKY